MFRASMCSSSGETIISMRHFVFVTLFGWLAGMRSSIRSDKYQVSHKYSCFSWWWAHSRPKRVEKRNKHTKETFRFLWPCIVSRVWREREKTNKMKQSDAYYQLVSTCFVHHYVHLQENKDRVLLHTTQHPITATNHIQQNQRSTPYAVTHGLCSPEDGHNDARNMLREKFIISIWLLHLVFFLSLHTKKCFAPCWLYV